MLLRSNVLFFKCSFGSNVTNRYYTAFQGSVTQILEDISNIVINLTPPNQLKLVLNAEDCM